MGRNMVGWVGFFFFFSFLFDSVGVLSLFLLLGRVWEFGVWSFLWVGLVWAREEVVGWNEALMIFFLLWW